MIASCFYSYVLPPKACGFRPLYITPEFSFVSQGEPFTATVRANFEGFRVWRWSGCICTGHLPLISTRLLIATPKFLPSPPLFFLMVMCFALERGGAGLPLSS
jgi:hypothetical protein